MEYAGLRMEDLPMKVRIFQISWIVVCFLQALRVVFSTLFGVIYDQIFEGPITAWLPISNVLVIFALLAPVLLARNHTRRRLMILAVVATLARISLSVDDANMRYWGALFVLAAAASYLMLMLGLDRKSFSLALVWGVVWEYLLRVLGDSFDLSLHDGSLLFVGMWGLLTIVIIVQLYRTRPEMEAEPGGIPWSLAFAIGSFLFLETSLFGLPGAVARYSTLDYPPMAVLLFLASALVLLPGFRGLTTSFFSLRRARLVVMVLCISGYVIGYFLNGWLAGIGLILTQLLLIGGMVYMIEDRNLIGKPTPLRLPLGLVWMLVLNFLNAFAFTYPYTLPAMRERGWMVFLLALLAFAWGLLQPKSSESRIEVKGSRLAPALVGLLTVLVLIAVWPQAPHPLSSGSLRLATWNIHYGYDDDWHTNLQEMAAVIAEEGIDVIALQEVDTGRMTSYSADNAYFLARRLGMQVVYLPAVEHLTGIALLYKGPEMPSDVKLLTSVQEQTGVVHAAIEWGTSSLDAYGIWMGLSDEDTLRQIDEALQFVGAASTASFGGDFNARPEDPEIDAVRSAGFADPFELLGIPNPPPTSPAIDPQGRIDYVWLRGLIPVRAWVSDSLASDHRMVVVEIAGK